VVPLSLHLQHHIHHIHISITIHNYILIIITLIQ
jgi:hypothetical protein